MKEPPASFTFKVFGLEVSGTGRLGIFAALFLVMLTLLCALASNYFPETRNSIAVETATSEGDY